MGKEDRHHRSNVDVPRDVGENTLQTDRRTRDRVRLFFWAVLTVVCLVAVMVARQQQEQGLQRKMEAAQERAVRFTQNVLADRLDAKRVSQPIGRSGYDELLTELKHGLFNDQRVVRVRVWREDGLLVFTTDHPDPRSGPSRPTMPAWTSRSPLRGDLTSVVGSESFARDDSTTPEPTALLSTFIPLRSTDKADVFGVVQIDNDYAMMVDATEHPWKQVQIAFAILALICLVMAIVSLVWSHRTGQPAGLPSAAGSRPSRREACAPRPRTRRRRPRRRPRPPKLRERVKELEGKTKSLSEQQSELEKLRNRVAEFESRPAPAQAAQEADPAEMAQLKAHASQLEEQARGAESRVTQLQSRVTEMEAQLRVTTDQLRMAQQRAEEAPGVAVDRDAARDPGGDPGEARRAAEVEQVLRDELEASRTETQRVAARARRDGASRSRRRRARSRDSSTRSAHRRGWPRKSGNASWPRPRRARPRKEAMSADAEARIKELTQQLERSEAERAMLRAGRPETVYEARNRQLEDELAVMRERLGAGGPAVGAAHGAGVDSGVIAALEERIAAAEERAREAERRLDEAAEASIAVTRLAPRRDADAEAHGKANGNGRERPTGTARADRDARGRSMPRTKPEAERAGRGHTCRRRSAGADRGRQRATEPVGAEHGRTAPGHLDADADARRPGRSAASAAAGRPRTCRADAGRSRPTAAMPARASRNDRPSRRARHTSGAALLG